MKFTCVLPLLALGAFAGPALAGDPWADAVVSYLPGSGVQPPFDNPLTALGEPTRFTGEGVFPGAVTPFNPPYLGEEIVSIGTGGHLIVRFDEPVTNDAANPFGIDLLVFGNSGYIDTDYPNGIAGGLFGGGDGGLIEVSPDGVDWFIVNGVQADGEYPTLGYLDLKDPYATEPGRIPSDFTRPVEPGMNLTGMSFADIVAAYAGSGGGAGVDIGALGLEEISFVRITVSPGSDLSPEIDGVADVSAVPAPGAGVVVLLLGARGTRRERRR